MPSHAVVKKKNSRLTWHEYFDAQIHRYPFPVGANVRHRQSSSTHQMATYSTRLKFHLVDKNLRLTLTEIIEITGKRLC